jgi:hypothetical protein
MNRRHILTAGSQGASAERAAEIPKKPWESVLIDTSGNTKVVKAYVLSSESRRYRFTLPTTSPSQT